MNPPRLRNHFDRAVWQSVFERNEYGLPDDMSGYLVLDVGGNVGAFSRLAAERGAIVTAYEPDPESFALLVANTAMLRVSCVKAAIYSVAGTMNLTTDEDPAGRNLFRGGTQLVRVAAFDDVLRGMVRRAWDLERPRSVLVKMDCEGSEYPICESSTFTGVAELLIEFHDNYVPGARTRAEHCRTALSLLGFRELRYEATHEDHGWYRLYHGRRRA